MNDNEQAQAGGTAGRVATSDWLASVAGLLQMAKCPCCDGSGTIIREGHGTEYVSRDMAINAGDASLEGSIYREAEPIIEQCQWCAERDALLANAQLSNSEPTNTNKSK